MMIFLTIIGIWLALNIAILAWRLCCDRPVEDETPPPNVVDLADYRRGRAA